MDLDKRLEEAWRGLVTETSSKPNLHWMRKRLDETRTAVADSRSRLIFLEVSLAAGERVLKEYDAGEPEVA